jgi:hypothetical protein
VSRHDRARRPARATASRRPKLRIYVACEGELTEPRYIRKLTALVKNPLVEVHFARERGDPLRVVELAMQGRDDGLRAATRAQDDSLAYDEVWCVFDRDQHERFADAIRKATDNNLRLAVSNPCFELWLLLHHREQPGAKERWELADMLRKHWPGYEKAVPDFSLEQVDQAQQRAQRLTRDTAERDDPPHGNPTTTAHLLVQSIRG